MPHDAARFFPVYAITPNVLSTKTVPVYPSNASTIICTPAENSRLSQRKLDVMATSMLDK
jgi:hypothetical protein